MVPSPIRRLGHGLSYNHSCLPRLTPPPPVAVHSGAARVSRLSDLWKPRFSKAYPKSHPYYVNFLGTQNVIKAAQLAGTRKVVRITGLSGRPYPS